MLSSAQFSDIRLHGDEYVLHAAGRGLMHAYPITKDSSGEVMHPTRANRQPVASMSWFGGKPTEAELAENSNTTPGTIYKVTVKPAHQRKGIATAMLHFARDLNPESHIRHSKALSPEGRAWAKAVR